jgi:hypothetical protein
MICDLPQPSTECHRSLALDMILQEAPFLNCNVIGICIQVFSMYGICENTVEKTERKQVTDVLLDWSLTSREERIVRSLRIGC